MSKHDKHPEHDRKMERHDGLAPGEGPSADRLDPEKYRGGGGGATMEPPVHTELTGEPGDHTGPVLNQDGSVLGSRTSWGGANADGGVGSKLVDGEFRHADADHLPIGGETAILNEEGQSKEQIPGVAGGPAPSDYGTSGHLGGDASNIGGEEDAF